MAFSSQSGLGTMKSKLTLLFIISQLKNGFYKQIFYHNFSPFTCQLLPVQSLPHFYHSLMNISMPVFDMYANRFIIAVFFYNRH